MPYAVDNMKENGRPKAGPFRARESAPPGGPVHPVLQLQQQTGNQAVQDLLRSGRIQAKLAISNPSDPAEQEANRVAEAVGRHASRSELSPLTSRSTATPTLARSALPPRASASLSGTPSIKANNPRAKPTTLAPKGESKGSGQPLAPHIQEAIQNSLSVDLSSVRVHTSPAAQDAAQFLSARAFTFGSDIFLGKGENPSDLGLIAHEATHVVQQQAAPVIQKWSGGRVDRYEREANRASSAVQRGESFSPRERVSAPRVQRWGVSDVLSYFAGAAYNIPGFRMFTLLIGVNPIDMQKVDRNAANLLRAAVEFIPGGELITKALDRYEILDRAGAWVQQQLDTLGIAGSTIKKALDDFIATFHWSDILDLGGVWERAKHIFTEPIERIKSFAKGLLEGIWKFIRDAILKPLAKLAESTAGWDLLTAVLGKNPITGEPVPRNADTLIGGFLKLIHEEEIWENIKAAKAGPRAWAWFQGALSQLMGFVDQIPSLFVQTLKSLDWADILDLPQGFLKVASTFGKFLVNFTTWAGKKVWDLLQIIFEVVAPGVMPYLRKVGAAFKDILKNPIGFVRNLVKAAMLGFQNFAANFGAHLKAGLIDWLTGSLPGVYIPKAFELGEIVKFVFSVLGISWQNIRAKLVKAVGEPAVKAMETGFDIVITLVTKGPAAAWDKIKDQLANLKDMVIGGITDFVVDMVVKKAVPKIVAMFIPGAGFISAILSIYDTIMVFVDKLKKIIQVVTAFVDSIVAIAGGAIGAAASRVETTLAGLLSLAINFLAGFAGLGKVADKVMGVVNKVRAPIDKALDWLINWIVTTAKKLFAKVFGKDKEKPVDPDIRRRWTEGMQAVRDLGARSLREPLDSDQIAKALTPIKTTFGFKALIPTHDGKDWRIHAVMNPEDDVRLTGKADRPEKLKGLVTPTLDKLEEMEGGVSARYVEEFGSYKNGLQTLLQYVERRAARKLGRIAEKPGLAAYAAAGGATSSKNTKTIELLKKVNQYYTVDRERIPDIFVDGRAVGDVKDVATQSNDEQMRDDLRIAKGDRVRLRGTSELITSSCQFDLIVRAPKDENRGEGTHVSEPLKAAIQGTGGKIFEVL
jgi:hypothetical protein